MFRTLLIVAVSCAVVGCDNGSLDAPPTAATTPKLTPETAQAALIDLIRSDSAGHLKGFPLDDFTKSPVEGGPGQSAKWGPFRMALGEKQYHYTLAPREDARACAWEFQGAFELRDGRWMALPPQVVSQALGAP
jgi:hypothetical protein